MQRIRIFCCCQELDNAKQMLLRRSASVHKQIEQVLFFYVRHKDDSQFCIALRYQVILAAMENACVALCCGTVFALQNFLCNV